MVDMLLAVTGQDLLSGQLVKGIFARPLLFAAAHNFWRAFRASGRFWKLWRRSLTLLFLFLFLPLGQAGTTIGFCEAFAKGKAISFEYQVDWRSYGNCNTYHPILVESTAVPGGKYYVRYSERYPEKGRMDFNIKVN
ncbi:MAG: hypothetical protein R2828_19640 [Saprospiraceae bacterium]